MDPNAPSSKAEARDLYKDQGVDELRRAIRYWPPKARLYRGGPYLPAKPDVFDLDPELVVAVDKEKRR